MKILRNKPNKSEHNLQILDVGSKFGIHPANLPFLNCGDHLLIDADPEECSYLTEKYKTFKNIRIVNSLVTGYSEHQDNPVKELNIYSHPGGDSVFEPEPDNIYWSVLRPGTSKIVKKIPVKTNTLDNICSEANFCPTYLKMDIEGSEVVALKGATHLLKNHLLCIRIEVLFNSLYKDQEATYADIYSILRSHGFVLVNFDLFANSFAPFSDYHSAKQFGQIIGGDCIFLKNPAGLSTLSSFQLLDYALFCLLNDVQDLAIKVLLDASISEPFVSRLQKNDINVNARLVMLEKEVAKLFFSLKDQARFSMETFSEPWEKIFGTKWIKHGDYYRKYPIS